MQRRFHRFDRVGGDPVHRIHTGAVVSNGGRLRVAIMRATGRPIDLVEGQRDHLGHLDFALEASCESGGGECVGCSQAGCWVWLGATFYSQDGSYVPVGATGLGVAMNGAWCGTINAPERKTEPETPANPCLPTATRGHTWGSIKSLYR